MATWIETRWHYIKFGSKSETFGEIDDQYKKYRADEEELVAQFNRLTKFCDEFQFEIKATMPLTGALSHQHFENRSAQAAMESRGSMVWIPPITAKWAFGYGWGISQNIGLAVLLQRRIDISDEEYMRRKALMPRNPPDWNESDFK